MWAAVLVGSLACYATKLTGLSVPPRVLDDPRVHAVAAAVPVALLAALVAVQTFTTDQRLTLDPRAAGVGAAVIAVRLRAPFLLVVFVAAATAALLRAVT